MEGNLNITFSVPKKTVMDMIATNSFYRGERVKDENGAHAARMQAGSDNNDILQDELKLATADVVAIITRNLGRCTVTEPDSEDGSYEFVTKGASNFPEELKTSIEGAIASYLFDKALEGWMLVNMPNEVQALGQRSAADAEKLRMLLVERKKPVR
jgi:hypothetical protein